MKVLILTGEISGDLYASLLVKRLRDINPSLHFIGIGGPKLRGTDTEILFSAESLSLIGIPKPSDLKKYFSYTAKLKKYFVKEKLI